MFNMNQREDKQESTLTKISSTRVAAQASGRDRKYSIGITIYFH